MGSAPAERIKGASMRPTDTPLCPTKDEDSLHVTLLLTGCSEGRGAVGNTEQRVCLGGSLSSDEAPFLSLNDFSGAGARCKLSCRPAAALVALCSHDIVL
jgi:hypothetical protein